MGTWVSGHREMNPQVCSSLWWQGWGQNGVRWGHTVWGKVQAHPTGHMVLPGLAETATQREPGGRFPLRHLLQFSLTQHLVGPSVAQGHLCGHAHLGLRNASSLQRHKGQLSRIATARGIPSTLKPLLQLPLPTEPSHLPTRWAGMALRIGTS